VTRRRESPGRQARSTRGGGGALPVTSMISPETWPAALSDARYAMALATSSGLATGSTDTDTHKTRRHDSSVSHTWHDGDGSSIRYPCAWGSSGRPSSRPPCSPWPLHARGYGHQRDTSLKLEGEEDSSAGPLAMGVRTHPGATVLTRPRGTILAISARTYTRSR
jgi:hypothetical protein